MRNKTSAEISKMALGNEVVAKNDPEEESKSVDDQIDEILSKRTENTEEDKATQEETQEVENTPTEVEETTEIENTPTEGEDTPTEVEETPTVEEPSPTDEGDTNENAVAEPEAEEEEEDEEDLIPPAQEEEEEEEEDLIDPVEEIREKCEAKDSCQKYLEKLEDCNSRVSGRSNTAETCHEEMMDWIHAVDHCVSHSLFNKVK